jgi:hypothetical protein
VFGVTVRLMSDGLLTRLEVLRDLDHRRLTTEAATRYWGSSVVRCFRLLKAYRTAGPAGLISKRRGRCSKAQAQGAAESGAGDHSRVALEFRPDLGGRELREVRSRDIATVDDRGRAVARSQAAAKARPSAPLQARLRRRAGAGRRLRALVV